MFDRRPILTIALVACLVLAGCSGGGSGADAPKQADIGAADGGGPGGDGGGDAAAPRNDAAAEASGAESDAGGSSVPQKSQPALIRTGTVKIEVQNYDAARHNLAGEARSMGGYVSGSEETRHRRGNRTWTTGYVVVRVPKAKFSTMLDRTKAEGTVLNEQTETRDVSDQLVDLEARLENLRAKRDRLRSFYDRVNTTDELLGVEERLSEVQGTIERLKAQKRSLEDQVAYSTLRIRIAEPVPAPETSEPTEPTTPYHERSVLTAFTDSFGALVTLTRATFVTLAYATPFVLAMTVPVAGIVLLWSRREVLFGLIDGLR